MGKYKQTERKKNILLFSCVAGDRREGNVPREERRFCSKYAEIPSFLNSLSVDRGYDSFINKFRNEQLLNFVEEAGEKKILSSVCWRMVSKFEDDEV